MGDELEIPIYKKHCTHMYFPAGPLFHLALSSQQPRARATAAQQRQDRTAKAGGARALAACATLAHAAAAPASADAGRAELLLAQRELASNLASRRRLLDKKEFAAD